MSAMHEKENFQITVLALDGDTERGRQFRQMQEILSYYCTNSHLIFYLTRITLTSVLSIQPQPDNKSSHQSSLSNPCNSSTRQHRNRATGPQAAQHRRNTPVVSSGRFLRPSQKKACVKRTDHSLTASFLLSPSS